MLRRSPELVWRSSAAGPGPATEPGSAHATSLQSRAQAPQHSQPLIAQGRGSDPSVIRATMLDPAVADRFADDVIRRMERRVRIERERRGL
jgi:hypothetical protein